MICRSCGLSNGPFKANTGHVHKSICKPCHNAYTARLQKGKQIALNPRGWWECDNCDENFKIAFKNDNGADICRYCRSEDIYKLVEDNNEHRAS